MMKSVIKGYYGSYQDALNAVGKRFKESGRFSIQMGCNDHKMHPWVLIYYGNFV